MCIYFNSDCFRNDYDEVDQNRPPEISNPEKRRKSMLGLPVVSSDRTELEDIMENEKDGVLSEKDSQSDFITPAIVVDKAAGEAENGTCPGVSCLFCFHSAFITSVFYFQGCFTFILFSVIISY